MAHAASLISTEDLARRLGAPALRVFDCTIYQTPGPDGLYVARSGREDYDKGHIPGAAYLDLINDLSDRSSTFRFTLPPLDELTKTFAAKGVGHGTQVVLYTKGLPSFATRVWWMLHAIGFDEVAILDGAFDKWIAEKRPVSTDTTAFPPATLSLRARPGAFVGKDEMKAAIGAPATLSLNALSHEQHAGTGGMVYGRAGRIAGSSCVPATSLLDADKTLKPIADLRAAFDGVDATQDKRILCYCGGGIAATVDAFVLTGVLGHRNVGVYDNSLQEWANDPGLPMEKD
jgi:thiosulfate/3-mercaptopyruvate sulfurtransferase